MSWLSCSDFCKRASRMHDGELVWHKRPGYWLHYLLCLSCRRFQKQLGPLDQFVRAGEPEAAECMEQHCLSAERAAVIKSYLAGTPLNTKR